MNTAGPTLRSQLLWFGALVLVSASIIAAFCVVPIMAVQAKIDEHGEYGVCNGVAPTCHDVPLETIADASGLDFPTGSVVASSSAAPSSFTAINYLQAVISVAEGSMPPGTVVDLPLSARIDESAVGSSLEEWGAESIVGLADGTGYRSIGFGTTPGARPDLVSVWKRLSTGAEHGAQALGGGIEWSEDALRLRMNGMF
jgi:hypothetical protein